MTWNYRVMAREYHEHDDCELKLAIHEVYYDKEGKVTTWTTSACFPFSYGTVEVLREELNRFYKALELPVLDHADGTEYDLNGPYKHAKMESW